MHAKFTPCLGVKILEYFLQLDFDNSTTVLLKFLANSNSFLFPLILINIKYELLVT